MKKYKRFLGTTKMKDFVTRYEMKLDMAERSFRRKLKWKYPWLGKDWWVSTNRNCMRDW